MAKNHKAGNGGVVVPHDLVGAAEFVRQIGAIERAITGINVKMNARIEKVKESFLTRAAEHTKKLESLMERLYSYAQKNRSELTEEEKKKTVLLPTGTMGWKMTRKAVSFSDKDAVIVARLEKLGLKRLIRFKPEPNKVAMLKEEDEAVKVPGITISQHEEFVVRPAMTKAEIHASKVTGQLKVVVALPKKKRKRKT